MSELDVPREDGGGVEGGELGVEGGWNGLEIIPDGEAARE